MRDEVVSERLRNKDWMVIRIWEHELKDAKAVATRIKDLLIFDNDDKEM